MSYRVLIENLAADKTVDDVRQLFADYGPIEWIFIEIDAEQKKPWGYAYVGLASEEQALRAVAEITGKSLNGEPLRLRQVESGPDIYVDKSSIFNSPPQYIFSQSCLVIEEAPPGAIVKLNGVVKAEVDREGRAEIKNLLPGKYTVSVSRKHKLLFHQDVPVSAKMPTSIGVIAGKSSGTVLLKEFIATNRPKWRWRWVLLVLILAVPAMLFGPWRYRQPVEPAAPPPPTPPPGMVYVPAGRFVMGRYSKDPFESPPHAVEVGRRFFLDKTEVTNGEYARFVEATGHVPPPHWHGPEPPAEIAALPVVNVNWQDAVDYCQWRNLNNHPCRLPTEMEWELAARGSDDRLYPWGNEWRDNAANANKVRSGPVAAGSFSGSASPYGALDMVGNVWEWTADDFLLYPLSKATPQPGVKVIRGGAFDSPPEEATGTFRGFLRPDRRDYDRTGFRCACDCN